jgi:hypothetical protein
LVIILKECGFILYKGQFPTSAIYLAYDVITKEYLWMSDSNDATIFPTMEYAKLIYPKYDSNIHKFRSVVLVDRYLE